MIGRTNMNRLSRNRVWRRVESVVEPRAVLNHDVVLRR
jgi:hypothetical protein